MKKFLLIAGMGTLFLLPARWSCADFDASTCFSGCNSAFNTCNSDALNDLEKSRCERARSECVNTCDAGRENDIREMRERASQQPPPDQAPPDQPPSDQPPSDQQ